MLASVLPARRATRVPPIAAVREGSTLPPGRFAAHSAKSGLAVLLASLAAVATGMFAGVAGALMALLLVLGVLGLFMGIALLAPSLVKPLARVVGWPARRAGGVAGDLAGANAVRNPGRTASTAAALMIGLTLVTVVAALGAGITAGTKAAISDQIHADYVVDGNEDLPFRADEGDKLASTQGVKAASHVRADEALVQGKENTITGVDPATIARFYTFKWTSGSERTLGQLGTDGALVTKSYADGQHLKVGSSVSVTTPSGAKRTLVVRGIYDPPSANQLLGDVSMSQQAFDKAFENPKNKFTFLAADAGADQALNAAAKDISDAKLHTGAAYPDDATKDMAIVLAMLYVLLGFSVVVSLFGMVNTMVLSVFERTREIGMLRTIGMTRRQARRMIRHESVITALIGAALGLGLGLFLVRAGQRSGGQREPAVHGPGPDADRVHAALRHRGDRRGDHAGTTGLAPERAGRPALRVGPRGSPNRPSRRFGGGAAVGFRRLSGARTLTRLCQGSGSIARCATTWPPRASASSSSTARWARRSSSTTSRRPTTAGCRASATRR